MLLCALIFMSPIKSSDITVHCSCSSCTVIFTPFIRHSMISNAVHLISSDAMLSIGSKGTAISYVIHSYYS